MQIGYALIIFLHVMAAIVWIGGTIFMALIIQPVIRKALSLQQRMAVYHETGMRFKKVQWVCLGILLLTGTFMVWKRGVPFESFTSLISTKIALVVVVIVLSFLHSQIWGPRLVASSSDPQSPSYLALVRKLRIFGQINLLASLVIIFLAILISRGN